jgi:DHA1 family multidrug resistance protein-like MFS transporter
VMILARALEGAVSAGFYPAANAYVSDVTTPENRGAAMGYISMGNMVGFVVGPTVGGVLAQFLGIRIPFLVAALGAISTLIAVMVLVQEPPTALIELGASQISRPPLLEVLRRESKAYTALGLSMFSNMFAIGILEVAFTLDVVETYGISPLEIGVFFGVLGIVTIVGNILFGKMSDRLGRKWLIVVGSFIGALSMYIFMVATDLPGFFLGGAILGIAISMRGPTIQALTADLTDKSSYGIVMGMMGAVSNSAYVVGPLLGGFLYDQNGNSYEALAAAVVVSCLGGVGALAGLPSRIRRPAVSLDSLRDSD